MARIEKTVFISYRRKDISWTLAVYQYLTSHGYDVFFDFTSIPSGDFEQIIISNIKARAHFLVILTPTALDRCSEPGDWLRREIETAIAEKRNIIPLFFDDFSFSAPFVSKNLTGKLALLRKYNGLQIPSGYFDEAMERMCEKYLNVALDAVLHPLPEDVKEAVKKQQEAASQVILKRYVSYEKDEEAANQAGKRSARKFTLSHIAIGLVALLILVGGGIGIASLFKNGAGPTSTKSPATTETTAPTLAVPAPTHTSTPVATVPPTPSIGSTLVSEVDGMVMVYVPAGEFTMGVDADDALVECQKYSPVCSLDMFTNEEPPHTLALETFWIDQTEVTNSMYVNFLNSIAPNLFIEADEIVNYQGYPVFDLFCEQCTGWIKQVAWDGSAFLVVSGYEDHPAVMVTWYGADAYCRWAGRRLPTEPEWEKAAGWDAASAEKYIYPWGNDFSCEMGNFDDESQLTSYVILGGENCDGYPGPSPVGSFPAGASPYGALDMAGNAWEWVFSLYAPYPYNASDGREALSSTYSRVLRGGAWLSEGKDVRTTERIWYGPMVTNHFLGFRCAVSP